MSSRKIICMQHTAKGRTFNFNFNKHLQDPERKLQPVVFYLRVCLVENYLNTWEELGNGEPFTPADICSWPLWQSTSEWWRFVGPRQPDFEVVKQWLWGKCLVSINLPLKGSPSQCLGRAWGWCYGLCAARQEAHSYGCPVLASGVACFLHTCYICLHSF